MRPRIVLAQLVIFAVISVSIILYTVFGVIGADPTSDPLKVTLKLSTGGGIYDGAEVAFRGVGVGRVDDVQLRRDGVTVQLSIDEGTRIPADLTAHVYDLSVVGEQYVDLVPNRTGGPLLADGATIPASRTTTAVTTPDLLYDVERLVRSLNPDDVRTISRELAAAFAGSAPQLRGILDSSQSIVAQLSDSRTALTALLRNGNVVLDTVLRHSQDFSTFADSLNKLTGTLKTSTPALEKLLTDAPSQARLLDAIVRDNGSAAAVLMSNLVTLGNIQVANIPGLRALLVAVPEFGRLVPQTVYRGSIQAAGLFNYTQRICNYGIPLTSPISGIRTPNTKVACDDPDLLPRGAANSPARTTTSGAAQVATYDPLDATVRTSGGKTVRLGADGGQDQVFGDKAWQTLLMPAGTP